jgi:hypothetical protein
MKFSLIIFALFVALESHSQTNEDIRGYIGITLGPAFPLEGIKNQTDGGTGLNINLINFGYTFGKNLGLTASLLGGAHLSKSVQADAFSTYGALLIGPLYSFKLTKNSMIHLRMMLGSVHSLFEYKLISSRSTAESLSIGYSVGVVYRYNFSKNWCLLLNSDYLSAKSSVYADEGKIAALNVNAGIGFRLR